MTNRKEGGKKKVGKGGGTREVGKGGGGVIGCICGAPDMSVATSAIA